MTLQQARALKAFEDVSEVSRQDDEFRTTYGTMALKLPALVRTAGLCQALHFVRSREKVALNKLLDHLGRQLARVDPGIRDGESLCKRAREAELAVYLQLTRETIATLTWYARLAQSELKIERTQESDR